MRTRTVGDIIQITKGRKHQVSDELTERSVRLIQIDDLRNDNNVKYTNDSKGVEVIESDVIIAWDGANAGTIGSGKRGYIGSTLARLKIRKPQEVDSGFLSYLLKTQFDYLRKTATGATIPHINRIALEKIAFPDISLTDQQRIARVLGQAETLIAKRNESLDLLDEWVKGVFLEMFGDPVLNPNGWEEQALSKVCNKLSDGPFGSNLKSEHYTESGVRVIRLNNIGSGEFLDDDRAFIPFAYYETLKKYTCYPGDVVIATMGTPNPRACLVPDNIGLAINKADCILCCPDKSIVLPSFIVHLVNSESFQKRASSLIRGQTRGRISMGRLSTAMIPLPPLALQCRFAAVVEQVERQKAQQRQSLGELETLYRSLSARAFRGELEFTGQSNPAEAEKQQLSRQPVTPQHSSRQELLFGEEQPMRREHMGQASIHYKTVSGILTQASGFMGDYDFTMNPYSGCSFGCSYCYAAFFARDNALKERWGHWVNVKENALAMLVRKRKRPMKGTRIYLGSVTDPYQPIEKELELTRSLLKELAQYHDPRLVIQTRSPLVTRDIDVLKRFSTVQVNMTITTDSEVVRKAFEPLCPANAIRLKAMEELTRAGIQTCITLTPLLPVEDAETFAQNLKATGVKRFIIQPFHAEGGKFIAGTREQAMKVIRQFDWSKERYHIALEVIRKHIPGIGIGKEGFAPI